MKKQLGIVFLLVSTLLLVPGLFMDVMTLSISIPLPFMGSQNLHNETQSILGTIGSLFENGNPTVAILITFFSVLIPFIKLVLAAVSLFQPNLRRSKSIMQFVSLISKWAMADVFVVGVFVAFLTTKSNEHIYAGLHIGFYFFAAYCLTSTLAFQFLSSHNKALIDNE